MISALYRFVLPVMILVRTVHIGFGGSQLYKAAAFSAGAFSQLAAAFAYFQPAAIFFFIGALFFGYSFDKFLY